MSEAERWQEGEGERGTRKPKRQLLPAMRGVRQNRGSKQRQQQRYGYKKQKEVIFFSRHSLLLLFIIEMTR